MEEEKHDEPLRKPGFKFRMKTAVFKKVCKSTRKKYTTERLSSNTQRDHLSKMPIMLSPVFVSSNVVLCPLKDGAYKIRSIILCGLYDYVGKADLNIVIQKENWGKFRIVRGN